MLLTSIYGVCAMKKEEYINISKVFSSSLVERVGASTTLNSFVPINEVAKAKGLSSNRSLRIAIQKGKYIAREVTVQGGKSYEIKYSSLEVEVQEKLEDEEIKSKSTALVPINNINNRINFVSENARLTALARLDIISALENIRKRYPTKKEADSTFIELYNSGLYLPQIINMVKDNPELISNIILNGKYPIKNI